MALPVAKELVPTTIPVIDLGAMRGDADARRALGAQIAQACADLGFFYIVNHGIDPAHLDALYVVADRFFALDETEKMSVALSSATAYRGYLPLKVMTQKPTFAASEAELKGNLYEAFQIHRELPPDDPDVIAGKPLHGANRWPASMPELRERMLAYFDEMDAFARSMLGLFALGLDLPEHRFDEYFRKPMMQLRMIHYPPQDPGDLGENIGLRPHTDSGAFTLLAQDPVGGLEIQTRDGDWIRIPPLDGSYVVNLGEMMRTWTAGILLATPHRVVNRSGKERFSIPFFATPDYDAKLAPLVKNPNIIDAPVFATAVSSETCGAHLVALYDRIWPAPVGAAS